MLKLLTAIKEKLDPVVWLVGAVLVPIFGVVGYSWHQYVYPYYSESIKSEAVAEVKKLYDDRLNMIDKSIQGLQTTDTVLFEQIKSKLLDEIDSTYFFAKRFTIARRTSTMRATASGSEGNSRDEGSNHQNSPLAGAESDSGGEDDQEPLEQFFYKAPNDIVKLFVWGNESHFDVDITINDGDKEKLEKIGDTTVTTGFDITETVKRSPGLDSRQYPGIGDNVYRISITPLYREDKHPKKPNNAKIVGSVIDLELYALLVIRRSPFK